MGECNFDRTENVSILLYDGKLCILLDGLDPQMWAPFCAMNKFINND